MRLLASTKPSIRPPGSAFKATRREAGDQDQADEAVHLGVELPAQLRRPACSLQSPATCWNGWVPSRPRPISVRRAVCGHFCCRSE